ncbi:hypothetical protein C900_04967 [Fulvivirga imtechensis AK7]|uniref:Co-chaperone DjlA N-terminal domain-containing protein n=1 Tax=Fulvivirga imtechensis AK7 TaxID=1237149 RepID=L8JKW1_9BACT|nr:hypothetical protein [Fulvivirga imtechensis]ELR69435.1 hypothetical protein C900_04967 [Fulvivirga imtechensis AK7]
MKDNPHLNILVQLAKIDGETDSAELELIRQIGASSNVSPEDIDEIIATTAAEDSIPSLEHLSAGEKVELMSNLVLVMKIDGRIHKEEMKFCMKVLKKLGYDEDALFDLVSTTFIDPQQEISKEDIKERAKKYLKK